jgi:hypothetical protein
VGEHLIIKTYNIEILQINNYVHLIIKKNLHGFIWIVYLPKMN